MRCRECHALLELRELPPATGEAGPLRVEVFGLRGGACPRSGHPLEPPYPDFSADLVAAVAVGDGLPKAMCRGLWRRRLVCGRCGAVLDAGGEPGTLRTRVRMEGVAPFTLSVEGPVAACGSCGHRQLAVDGKGGHRGLEAALEQVLLDALGDMGLAAGRRAPARAKRKEEEPGAGEGCRRGR